MFKKIYSLVILSIAVISNHLSAAIKYDIQDIGTLQTHSSQAIAINNQGQILGWYNVDGSANGKHFFVRDQDGNFNEVPNKENGVGSEINWRYLTNDGKAYGTCDGNTNFAVLYVWDQENGAIKLGNLPGKEISAINDAGQVLIKSIVENENGKSIRRPVIWQNGKITKLIGSGGDLGIESNESYGFDMNNNGDVVGQSTVYLSYKDKLYTQVHATKWINGQAIDIHNTIPKSNLSKALKINDRGDVLLEREYESSYEQKFIINNDKSCVNVYYSSIQNIDNNGNSYWSSVILGKDGRTQIFLTSTINDQLQKKADSIWNNLLIIIKVNDKGEIIAKGKTIYGEEHAMLLVPVKQN